MGNFVSVVSTALTGESQSLHNNLCNNSTSNPSQKIKYDEFYYFTGFRCRKYNSNLLTCEYLGNKDFNRTVKQFPFPLSFPDKIEPIKVCFYIQKDSIKLTLTYEELRLSLSFDSDTDLKVDVIYYARQSTTDNSYNYSPDAKFGTIYSINRSAGINQEFSCTLKLPEGSNDLHNKIDLTPLVIQLSTHHSYTDSQQLLTLITFDHRKPHTSTMVDYQITNQYLLYKGFCFTMQDIFGIDTDLSTKPASKKQKSKISQNENNIVTADEVSSVSLLESTTSLIGVECVVCMSSYRDTLVLPCRHLCLCHQCGEKLLYQTPSCPICRSTFRGLLQLENLKKYLSSNKCIDANNRSELHNNDNYVDATKDVVLPNIDSDNDIDL